MGWRWVWRPRRPGKDELISQLRLEDNAEILSKYTYIVKFEDNKQVIFTNNLTELKQYENMTAAFGCYAKQTMPENIQQQVIEGNWDELPSMKNLEWFETLTHMRSNLVSFLNFSREILYKCEFIPDKSLIEQTLDKLDEKIKAAQEQREVLSNLLNK